MTTTPALPPGEIDRLFRKHGGWLEDDNGQCPAFWQMPMDNLFPFVREAAALSAVEVRMLTEEEMRDAVGFISLSPSFANQLRDVQRAAFAVNNLKVKEQGNGN
jgi:hypothetical protein